MNGDFQKYAKNNFSIYNHNYNLISYNRLCCKIYVTGFLLDSKHIVQLFLA